MARLLDVRFIIERSTGGQIENDWLINIANDAQAEFSLNINIQDSGTIALTASDIEYDLPTELKIINRLWLQSEFDAGIDKEFKWTYRTYNGKIIFRQPWHRADTLNVDFYRNMKYFADIEDEIDLDDRFTPLYTSYGQREYYDMSTVKAALGEAQARQEYDKHNMRYMSIKQQVTSYYAIQNDGISVNERW